MLELELKKVSKPAEQQHVFLFKGMSVNFSLTVKNSGQPRANENYLLSIDADSFRRGHTDKNETLKTAILPKARCVLLLLNEDKTNQ